jgi:hypothetical protein
MMPSRALLLSEVKELEYILSQIPSDEIIERRSFETRLAVARKNLGAAQTGPAVDKARLTFRGRPVLGSQGVAADFGSKAVGAFADAFAAVVAGLNENLRYMGPIPDRARNQLLITGTAIGSFGFEFSLPPPEPDLFPNNEKSAEALQKMQSLLRVSASGSDDEVAELVEVMHPRAVKKVAEFLSLLAQQQAWCGLEFQNEFFRFSGIEQLQFSAGRLQEENIRERVESYAGEFQGVLPSSRTFEFKLMDQSGVIKGKVAPTVDDPDVLNREWLHKPVVVRFDVFQVGQGLPRFALRALSDVQLSSSD